MACDYNTMLKNGETIKRNVSTPSNLLIIIKKIKNSNIKINCYVGCWTKKSIGIPV